MLTPEQIKAMQAGVPKNFYQGSPYGGGESLTDMTAPYQAPSTTPTEFHPIEDFAKSLVSAPATMLARPFQASAEALGASAENVDKFSSKYSGGLVASVPQNAGDVGKDVGRGIQTAAFGLGPVAGGAAFMGGSAIEQGKGPVDVAIDTALGAAGGKLLGLVGKPVFNAAGKIIGKVTPDFIQNLASKGTEAIQDFAASHDIMPQFASDAINSGADAVNKAVEGPMDKVSQVASNLTQGAKDRAEGLATKVTDNIKGKSTADILATKPEDLNTLSAHERNTYFDAKQEESATAHNANIEGIKQQQLDLEKKIDAESQTKLVAQQEQNASLDKDVTRATLAEAQSLKPKVIKAMGDNSQIYRDLIEKEIAPVRDVEVSSDELKSYIAQKYGEGTPEQLDMLKKLNIQDGENATVGSIFDNMKALKQDIGSAGKKGARVFTPEEMKTNDAIATLSDYLKETHGLDFKEANSFWKNYAPLRDKIIQKIQPFTPAGSEKATFNTFARSIRKTIDGTDPNNEEFISKIEDLLGTKIGSPETRSAIEKLSQSQKQGVIDQAELEMKKADVKIDAQKKIAVEKAAGDADKKALAEQKYELERQTKMKEYIKKGIIGLVGLGGFGVEESIRKAIF